MSDTDNVYAAWRAAAERHGDRVLLEGIGEQLTYREVAALIERAASALALLGVDRGERVALLLGNTPWYPIAFFATLSLGAVVVNLSPLDAIREYHHKLSDSGARWIVAGPADELLGAADVLHADGIVEAVVRCDASAWRSLADAGWIGQALAAERRPVERSVIARQELALIQYTGGTTGVHKGVKLTHANLLAAAAMFDAALLAQPLARPGRERHLVVLPLFHIYALASILVRSIRYGDTLLLRERFDPEQTLLDIAEGRATWFFAVPTMLIALLQHPAAATSDCSSLTCCVAGGAPLPQEIADRVAGLIGRPPMVGWGMTETTGAGTLTGAVTGERAGGGMVGYPLTGAVIDIVALDDPARPLAPGEVGEVRVAGPHVTAGYWQRPDETAAAFSDGRLLTGDIGYVDDAGRLVLIDRKKDLIISSGFNVYPATVENAIYEHPAVSEVLVYGAADPYRGEVAVAAVTLRAGATLDLEALRGFLAGRIGRHELPARLDIRDALPRTAVGKLSRRILRDQAARETFA